MLKVLLIRCLTYTLAMLLSNNESEIKKIIEDKGKDGWLRTEHCAKEFAKDPKTKKYNHSRRTKFYRICRRIKDQKVEGLKVLLLAGNISYIGLSSADPKIIGDYVSSNKKASRNVRTGLKFYEWRERRVDRKKLERKEADERIDLELRTLGARCRKREMIREYYITNAHKGNKSIPQKIIAEIENECKKQFGLSETDTL
jgi:hypothetical protein